MTISAFAKTASSIRVWWNGLRLFWQAQIVGWGLFAIVDLLNQRLVYHDITISMLRTTVIVPCLIVLSSILHAIYAAHRFRSGLTLRSVTWAALLSIGGAALVATLAFTIRELVGGVTPGRDALDEFVLPLIHYSIVLVGWSLCYFWVRAEAAKEAEHKHAMRAEAEALRAELEELRLQLDPHFLFNALNGVAEEIPEHPAAALAMLRDLTAYLRHSLDGIRQTVVTVEAEVAALAAYLRVQQARFGERLATRLEVDPAAQSHRIASFLLQPLVENAVKHGKREQGLEVAIDIRSIGEGLHVEIANTGTLGVGTAARRRRPGIGLDNVRRRLALHYPGRHIFTLRQNGGDRHTVIATLVLEGDPCSGS